VTFPGLTLLPTTWHLTKEFPGLTLLPTTWHLTKEFPGLTLLPATWHLTKEFPGLTLLPATWHLTKEQLHLFSVFYDGNFCVFSFSQKFLPRVFEFTNFLSTNMTNILLDLW
jgi:hypothetical protein